MKSVTILLLLVLGCCFCEPQNTEGVQESIGPKDGDYQYLVEKVQQMEKEIVELRKMEKEIVELRTLVEGQPRVAFSATLMESGHGVIGPFTVATPLKYKKVFSNIGSGYNPSTGVFTALVKGMYFFRFSAFNNAAVPEKSIVNLRKNGERLVSVWDEKGSDTNDMGSNAVVVALETGDNVYVQLATDTAVYDDAYSYNTFSGFLLFPMQREGIR